MNATQCFLAMVNRKSVLFEGKPFFIIQMDKKNAIIEIGNESVKIDFAALTATVPENTRPIDNDLDIFTCTAMDKATFYGAWDDETENRDIELEYPHEDIIYNIVLESLFGDDSLEDNIKYYINKFLDEKGY